MIQMHWGIRKTETCKKADRKMKKIMQQSDNKMQYKIVIVRVREIKASTRYARVQKKNRFFFIHIDSTNLNSVGTL